MNIISYISNFMMPFFICIIVLVGIIEKKEVFTLFEKGAKEGTKIVFNIFPTLLGLFLAVGLLKSSGIMEFLFKILSPALNFMNMPKEILPLALFRPISGNASTAIAIDIMKENGVDSLVGIMAAVIMGATETTLYVLSIYTSAIKVDNTRNIIWICLIADVVGIVTAVIVCRIMSTSFC